MSDEITLKGRTPIMYFDPDDEATDGKGYNVLYADGAFVERYGTVVEASEAFVRLVDGL